MAKKLTDVNTKTKPKNFVCSRCMGTFGGDQFYSFPTFPASIIPCCKECMYAFAIRSDGLYDKGLQDLCKYLDLPYFQNYYEEVKTKKVSPKWQLSQYINKLRVNKSVHDLHFKDSIFEIIDEFNELHGEEVKTIDLSEGFTAGEIESNEEVAKERKSKKKELEMLQTKWGKHSSLDYLHRCEALYQEIVQGGYIVRSSMHDISVRHYCRLQAKWDIAQENEDYVTMKELSQPLKDARKDAKLNPSQLTPEDFSTGGANSFSEISRLVAQKHGFIPLPMKYYKQPNDALDFIIWEIINYDRHMIGLEEVPYEEIYQYYINEIEDFNKRFDADIENGDLGTLDEQTRGNKRVWTLI